MFFTNCEYLGIDVGPGRGVDLVCEGQSLDHPNESYDTVGSCECFEHNPHWVETFNNMVRMTKPGGLVFMTCATTGREEHGTRSSQPDDSPLSIDHGWSDYYKNLTQEDFTTPLNLEYFFDSYFFETNEKSYDLYFCGVKK
jgi:SAM-dependent methyltransferase